MRKYIEQETAVAVVDRLARKCGNEEMAFALNWAARELLEVPAAFEEAQVGTFRKIPAEELRKALEDHTGLEPKEIIDRLAKEKVENIFTKQTEKALDKLMEYQTAEAEGRLLVLPCKVGDTVYWIHGHNVLPVYIQWFETNAYGWCACGKYPPMATPTLKFDDFGKTVFLTREEAEAALKEGPDA